MNKIKIYLGQHLFISLFAITVMGCENEFKKEEVDPNTNPPVVTSISTIQDDIEVTQGVLQGFYMVRGKNLSSMVSVHFNGQEASFNPAILTDSIAFISVPMDTPPSGDNIMLITTLGGVVEVDFPILIIQDFEEEYIDGDRLVNLTGGGFNYTPAVIFTTGSENLGNLEEFEATVREITATSMVVEVPDEVAASASIVVTTVRGASSSIMFGPVPLAYSIFIDDLEDDWQNWGWGGTWGASTEQAFDGSSSIKKTFDGSYDAIQFGNGSVDVSGYTYMVFYSYGTADSDGQVIQINLNDSGTGSSGQFTVSNGTWTEHEFIISDLTSAAGSGNTLTKIVLQQTQDFTGDVYFDFVGFR